MERALAFGGAATSAISTGRTSAVQVLGKVTETAAAAATQGTAAAKEARETVSAAAKGKRDEFKKEVKTWLLEVIYDQVEKLIARGPRIIKNYMDDPDMPNRVKRIQDRIIDKAWPDIREEIMWEVAVQLDGKQPNPDEDLGPAPWYYPRGFLRYHIYPYDKAMWGRVRDPFWVIFTLGSLTPVSGFYALVYAVLFLIIDKSDEFQLIYFILQFKGTQFLSHGVIRTIMGFFMFVNCVSSSADESHSCETYGPGTAEFYQGMYEFAIFGWVLQVVMMWAAYFCLRNSTEKGRRELKGRVGTASEIHNFDAAGLRLGPVEGDQAKSKKKVSTKVFEHTGATGPGGYIRYFLLYDAVCFIIVVCGLFIVIALRSEGVTRAYHHWSIRHAFFSAQVIYGYLSMPFFLFLIPVLVRFLTHSIDTAYDQKGRCVAYVGPKRKKDEDEEEQSNRWGSMFDTSRRSQESARVALNAKLEALYDKVTHIVTHMPKGRRTQDGHQADV